MTQIERRQVFVCLNGDCAPRHVSERTYERLVSLLEEYQSTHPDVDVPVKIKTCGCLDVCKNGPIVVVHPDRIYYQHVDLENASQIFTEHLIGGRVVEELVVRRGSSPPTD